MTVLEKLNEMMDDNNLSFKKMAEIRYRKYILEELKFLKSATVELDTVEECLTHKEILLCICDYMCSSEFRKHKEGSAYDHKCLRNFIAGEIEHSFFSIFSVEKYRQEVLFKITKLTTKWWEYRQSILPLELLH